MVFGGSVCMKGAGSFLSVVEVTFGFKVGVSLLAGAHQNAALCSKR